MESFKLGCSDKDLMPPYLVFSSISKCLPGWLNPQNVTLVGSFLATMSVSAVSVADVVHKLNIFLDDQDTGVVP